MPLETRTNNFTRERLEVVALRDGLGQLGETGLIETVQN